MGEVTSLLKYWAQKMDVNLTVIRTNGWGTFNAKLGLDNCDAVITVLESIDQTLMSEIERRGIPSFQIACQAYNQFGAESILSNNQKGCTEAFDHLYQLGHRNIGFVADFKINDMVDRFNTYRQRLEYYDLPFDESNVIKVSDPSLDGGQEAGAAIARKKDGPTAYVVAADLLVVGILQVIKSHGIRCPEDIAMVGFEATAAAWNHSPKITAVDQKMFDVVRVTFERIIKRLNGEPFESEPILIDQKLYIGESCGADPSRRMSDEDYIRNKSNEVNELVFEDYSVNQNESLMAFAKGDFKFIMGVSYLYGPFFDYGIRARWPKDTEKDELKIFSEFTSVLLPDDEFVSMAESRFPPNSTRRLSEIEHRAVTIFPITVEGDHWEIEALYQDLSKPINFNSQAMFHSFLDAICVQVEREALVTVNTENLNQTREISHQLSELNSTLESKVRKRTQELEKSNIELTQAIDRMEQMHEHLLQSEKMTLLGQMVAGVAHEINTPVGVALTAASSITDVTLNLKSNLENEELTKSGLEKYLSYVEEASDILVNNLYKATSLIKTFKEVSVDQSSEQKRNFNLDKYIRDVISTLSPKTKNYRIQFKLNIDESLNLNSYPGAYSQIITNFIMNSLIHGFDKDKSYIISIDVQLNGDFLEINYKDDGKGIDDSIIDQIFDPFFTTKRSEGGSGLGLNIVSSLVIQRLGGTIKAFHSDMGVYFKIIIPKTQLA